jgi:hypothetical protein
MTFNLKRTPFSSMSALMDWMATVVGAKSRLGCFCSLGG